MQLFRDVSHQERLGHHFKHFDIIIVVPKCNGSLQRDIRFTTWEDFAIMAMAEKGLGIGILPDIILRRIPYKLEIRSLEVPYYKEIELAMKNRNRLTPATQKFIEYLN